MDMQKFERTANAIQFATEKLEEQLGTIEGLENLPRIVQETYSHTKAMQKARPASIIFGSLLGVVLGAALGATVAYHFAKPLDLAAQGYGINVMHTQSGNATFYFQKGPWRGSEQPNHFVLEQVPSSQQNLTQRAGQALVDKLDGK